MMNQPSIWIVIPCYNEAERLDRARFEAFCAAQPAIGFCFVDDGSQDATAQRIEAMAAATPAQICAMVLPRNGGKADAVRAGVRALLDRDPAPRAVGYWDADLATPLDEISTFRQIMDQDARIRFVCGARIQRMGAQVRRKRSRHYTGRIFGTLASLSLGLTIYDTQCGAKLIEAGLARQIFARPFLSSWLFDVELLARIRNGLGIGGANRCIYEVPLSRWDEIEGSKIRLTHFLRFPLELWRIHRAYRRPQSAEDSAGWPGGDRA